MITARPCARIAVTLSDVLIPHDDEENIMCTTTSRLKMQYGVFGNTPSIVPCAE
jgi:hypothetical protein